jgi:hypothetical protein
MQNAEIPVKATPKPKENERNRMVTGGIEHIAELIEAVVGTLARQPGAARSLACLQLNEWA